MSSVKRAKRYTARTLRERFGLFRASRGEKPSRWHRSETARTIRRMRNSPYGVRGIPK